MPSCHHRVPGPLCSCGAASLPPPPARPWPLSLPVRLYFFTLLYSVLFLSSCVSLSVSSSVSLFAFFFLFPGLSVSELKGGGVERGQGSGGISDKIEGALIPSHSGLRQCGGSRDPGSSLNLGLGRRSGLFRHLTDKPGPCAVLPGRGNPAVSSH